MYIHWSFQKCFTNHLLSGSGDILLNSMQINSGNFYFFSWLHNLIMPNMCVVNQSQLLPHYVLAQCLLKITEFIACLCFPSSSGCGSHLESGWLQMFISYTFTRSFRSLHVSVMCIQWFMRYFANRTHENTQTGKTTTLLFHFSFNGRK